MCRVLGEHLLDGVGDVLVGLDVETVGRDEHAGALARHAEEITVLEGPHRVAVLPEFGGLVGVAGVPKAAPLVADKGVQVGVAFQVLSEIELLEVRTREVGHRPQAITGRCPGCRHDLLGEVVGQQLRVHARGVAVHEHNFGVRVVCDRETGCEYCEVAARAGAARAGVTAAPVVWTDTDLAGPVGPRDMNAVLVILDGWALNPDPEVRDAVAAADTPNFDRFREAGAFGTLVTSGRRVGLPEGQMGNSEVGHLNIGAGRVVTQESARVTDAIERWRVKGNRAIGGADEDDLPEDVAGDGAIDENEAILSAFDYAREQDGRVHFMGLVSDGGVHSYQSHLHALIELAADNDVEAVTHAFTDGRDTSPTGGEDYLADLQAHADEQGTGHVATVSGRYYAMDRDTNWDRTRRAYDAIVNREAEHEAASAVDAVTESYERGDTDEFVEPTLVSKAPRASERERQSREQNRPALADGDAVVFFNFRSDRARQLTRMLADVRPEDWGGDTTPPECRVVTMTEYDETFDLPVAFPPILPEDTLGEVLSGTGHTQLRIAETEKYAHVTYFLNGGREVEFEGERREIVESPDVPTYDLQPEMSAAEVTDTAIAAIESADPDVLVLNYANPDMVGHTGDFEAAVAAVEAVDEQLGRLVAAILQAGGHVLVTADHGNADDMGTPEEPYTAHTTNPVPLVYLDPMGGDGGHRIREDGALEDLAPTLLALVGVAKPAAMTGENLLE